jgi:hypothetical protein
LWFAQNISRRVQNEWLIGRGVRWFNGPAAHDFSDGSERRLSLHIPPQITGASRLRLAAWKSGARGSEYFVFCM